MLNIYIDNGVGFLPKDYISQVSDYFCDEYEPEWFADEFVRRAVRVIDKSEVIGVGKSINIYNETLGNIPPDRLSNGCKSIILLYETGVKINGDRIGDNCVDLLIDISKMKDITISLTHAMKFPNRFDAIIINNNVKVSSRLEFLEWLIKRDELKSLNRGSSICDLYK